MHFACIRFSLLHLEWPKPPQEKLKIPQNITKGSAYTPVIDENTLRLELSRYTFDSIVAVSEPWIMQNTNRFSNHPNAGDSPARDPKTHP